MIPAPPPQLGGESLTDLLESGKVKFEVDPKYPQAVGISNILGRVAAFGNFKWDILINENRDCPFFTSDFPVGTEPADNGRVSNRIVPLAPSIAVRFRPDINLDRDRANYEFSNFSFERLKVSRQEAITLNRLLVRSAEDTVFFRDDRPWIVEFIEKNRHFRTGTVETKHPAGLSYQQAIVRFDRAELLIDEQRPSHGHV